MIELGTKYRNFHKRVVFPKGKQKDFLEKIQTKLNLTPKEFAELAGICVRSMTDWKREKLSMSLPAFKKLCQRVRISLPNNIKIKDPFWYTSNGGSAGGIAVYKKYGYVGGNPKYRKKKWYEWWERVGRFNPNKYFVVKEIALPQKNVELAEFVGILLGDGGLTKKQVTITLNRFDDRDFIPYVKNLIQKLFAVNPSISERKRESVANIVVSRTKLVQFFVKMGLCIGSKVKHQVDVPFWIKESKELTKSCLRGLFDTDGCFYVDKHYYKGKTYYNCAMCFRNRSLPVLTFFRTGLQQVGFHPTHNTRFSISLRREDEIIKYFQTIGSSNPKCSEKFKDYFKNRLERYRSGYNGAASKAVGPF